MALAQNYARPALNLQISHVPVIPIEGWIQEGAEWRGSEFSLPTKQRLGFVIHYPGVPQFGGIEDPIATFRRIQREYLFGARGYSNGYNFGVFSRGQAIVNRGFFRSAANGSTETNNVWCAIFLGIDDDDLVTTEMRHTVQRIIHYGRQVWNVGLGIVGHQQLKSTSCPGPAMEFVRNGGFEPDPSSWPENKPVDPPKPPPIVVVPPVDPGPKPFTPGDLSMFKARLPLFGDFLGLVANPADHTIRRVDGLTFAWTPYIEVNLTDAAKINAATPGSSYLDILRSWINDLGLHYVGPAEVQGADPQMMIILNSSRA